MVSGPSAAKAAVKMAAYGTAEAVPFQSRVDPRSGTFARVKPCALQHLRLEDSWCSRTGHSPVTTRSLLVALSVGALRAILKFMALPDFTPRVANDPKSVVIHLTTGTGMEIEWKDGHRSVYTFAFLRDACPCALCDEERTKSGRKLGEAAKLAPGALPMFKAAVKALTAEAVGKYALKFGWSDRHDMGIYSWFYLREFCPCAECSAARGV